MKKMIALALAALLTLAGCTSPAVEKLSQNDSGALREGGAVAYEVADGGGYDGYVSPDEQDIPWNTEEYAAIKEHGFISVASAPFSTFSADVDTASYCNVRRLLNGGATLEDLPAGAVRVEEMLNYFHYDYAAPTGSDLFGVTAQIADCPWNPDTKLLVMGLQTADALPAQANAGNNFVFLIDTSGSMDSPDKLPLLQQSFGFLLDQLGDDDTISIVTYSGEERVVLEGAKASERMRILSAIRGLRADGCTNGQSGLSRAYDLAQRYYIPGGNNRIIMASDGDLNVGLTSESDLSSYVGSMRDKGIYLSVLGFGAGNYKDTKMETIADDGNGCYYYIDCLDEAKRIFGEDLTATLYTVADDVKLQLEFNPAYVKAYRQIGYENREMTADEFKDDKVDAGEVGCGHSVTVAYELVMVDSPMQLFTSDSRYGAGEAAGVQNGEWFVLNVRAKEPGSTEAQQWSYAFGEKNYTTSPSDDWKFASCVIEFGMLCNKSENLGSTTPEALRAQLDALDCSDDERRAEFCDLALWALA